jgi:hypothetical protein
MVFGPSPVLVVQLGLWSLLLLDDTPLSTRLSYPPPYTL